MPNGRCRMHNGNAAAGIANGNYKHGRNSKYLTAIPSRLKTAYRQLRERDDLLEQSNEIALIDARLRDVLARVDTGEAGALWRDLQAALAEFEKARAKGIAGVPDMNAALERMKMLIERGAND